MDTEVEERARKTGAQPLEAALIPDAMLTPETVAQLLGIRVRTLRQWVAEGKFPPPKRITGKIRRWRAQVVTDFLASVNRAAP